MLYCFHVLPLYFFLQVVHGAFHASASPIKHMGIDHRCFDIFMTLFFWNSCHHAGHRCMERDAVCCMMSSRYMRFGHHYGISHDIPPYRRGSERYGRLRLHSMPNLFFDCNIFSLFYGIAGILFPFSHQESFIKSSCSLTKVLLFPGFMNLYLAESFP